jgi:DMSO/TMAO reductase YedYZ molybdopterin-dependent catalytic subunit
VRSVATIILLVLLTLAPSARGGGVPTLRVSGPDGQSAALTVHDLDAMPHASANVVDEKGNHALYDGVPVSEILRRIGMPNGDEVRGQRMALYMLVSASDGYEAVFAIAELDHTFTDRVVLLAYRRDGKALPAAEGPFRFVVPDEKRHARWVRNVTSLSIKRAGE